MHGRSPLQGGNSAFITLLRARPSLHTLLRDGSQSRDAAQSGQCEGGWFQHVLIAATHTVFYSYLGFCVLDMDGLARFLSMPLFLISSIDPRRTYSSFCLPPQQEGQTIESASHLLPKRWTLSISFSRTFFLSRKTKCTGLKPKTTKPFNPLKYMNENYCDSFSFLHLGEITADPHKS